MQRYASAGISSVVIMSVICSGALATT